MKNQGSETTRADAIVCCEATTVGALRQGRRPSWCVLMSLSQHVLRSHRHAGKHLVLAGAKLALVGDKPAVHPALYAGSRQTMICKQSKAKLNERPGFRCGRAPAAASSVRTGAALCAV